MRLDFVGALNVYRTMAQHPALLTAWAPLRQYVVKESALGAVGSELVILRAAHRMGSDYEWTHHTPPRSIKTGKTKTLGHSPRAYSRFLTASNGACTQHRTSATRLAERCASANVVRRSSREDASLRATRGANVIRQIGICKFATMYSAYDRRQHTYLQLRRTA